MLLGLCRTCIPAIMATHFMHLRVAMEWTRTEVGWFQLSIWLSSASSMVDTLWCVLICNTKIFILCVHTICPFMCLYSRFLDPSFLIFYLPGPRQDNQAIHHCSWVCMFHTLSHKVGDQIYYPKLYPLKGLFLTTLFQKRVWIVCSILFGTIVQPLSIFSWTSYKPYLDIFLLCPLI